MRHLSQLRSRELKLTFFFQNYNSIVVQRHWNMGTLVTRALFFGNFLWGFLSFWMTISLSSDFINTNSLRELLKIMLLGTLFRFLEVGSPWVRFTSVIGQNFQVAYEPKTAAYCQRRCQFPQYIKPIWALVGIEKKEEVDHHRMWVST